MGTGLDVRVHQAVPVTQPHFGRVPLGLGALNELEDEHMNSLSYYALLIYDSLG